MLFITDKNAKNDGITTMEILPNQNQSCGITLVEKILNKNWTQPNGITIAKWEPLPNKRKRE